MVDSVVKVAPEMLLPFKRHWYDSGSVLASTENEADNPCVTVTLTG